MSGELDPLPDKYVIEQLEKANKQLVEDKQELMRNIKFEIDARMAAEKHLGDLAHEIERNKILIQIADTLITNDNAKADWEAAKKVRVQ